MQRVYFIACGIGAALPLSQFLPWLASTARRCLCCCGQRSGRRSAAFAWLDVLASAAVLIVFMFAESRRLEMPAPWLPLLGLCLVGVSVALPLFLLLRQRQLARQA